MGYLGPKTHFKHIFFITFFETSGTNLHGNVVDTDERVDGVHGANMAKKLRPIGANLDTLSNYRRTFKFCGYVHNQ